MGTLKWALEEKIRNLETLAILKTTKKKPGWLISFSLGIIISNFKVSLCNQLSLAEFMLPFLQGLQLGSDTYLWSHSKTQIFGV